MREYNQYNIKEGVGLIQEYKNDDKRLKNLFKNVYVKFIEYCKTKEKRNKRLRRWLKFDDFKMYEEFDIYSNKTYDEKFKSFIISNWTYILDFVLINSIYTMKNNMERYDKKPRIVYLENKHKKDIDEMKRIDPITDLSDEWYLVDIIVYIYWFHSIKEHFYLYEA